jgi:hypothetical protein
MEGVEDGLERERIECWVLGVPRVRLAVSHEEEGASCNIEACARTGA